MKKQSIAIRKKIDAIDLLSIAEKSQSLFVDAPALLGPNGEHKQEALDEFRHFLFLVWWNKKQRHQSPVVPTKRADVLWHGFLIFNQQYNQFCHDLYGEVLHHKPGLEEGTSDFDLAGLHTRSLHKEVGKYGYDRDYFSHIDTSQGRSALKGNSKDKGGSSCGSGFASAPDGGGCGGD